jgi:hypothetical protein
MAGLDPAIHDAEAAQQTVWLVFVDAIMDCRVKPGNDAERVVRSSAHGAPARHLACAWYTLFGRMSVADATRLLML